MATKNFMLGSQAIPIDEHGYLLDPEDWNPELAEALARDFKLDMTAEHWMVVNFVRKWYLSHQSVPEARHALKAMKNALGNEKATRKYLYQLFPFGYAIQACKIAGMRIPLKLMLDL